MRVFEEKDFEQMRSWVQARGKVTVEFDSVPRVGLIQDGLACGFVEFLSGDTFMLEAFATNPEADAFKRGKAVLDIAVKLVEHARSHGRKRCNVITREDTVMERLELLGFKVEKVHFGTKYFG